MEMQSDLGTGVQTFKNVFKNFSDKMHICIQNCTLCFQTCEQMMQHCLNKGGVHAEPEHLRILQDCADISALSVKFMVRDSNLHHQVCELCAEACLACAKDCEQLGDDEIMQQAVDICRRCAESCQEMARHH